MLYFLLDVWESFIDTKSAIGEYIDSGALWDLRTE